MAIDAGVITDEKRGWSSFCRRGDHRTCETVGARCTCPRHGPGGQSPPAPRLKEKEADMPKGIPGSGPYSKVRSDNPARSSSGPVIELEWEEPPPDVPTAVVPYLDVLEQLKERRSDWGRIATFDTTRGAGASAASLKKALADGVLGNFEFEARRNGNGSKLYARCTGGELKA